MKTVLTLLLTGAALSFAACGNNASVKGMSEKDSATGKMESPAAGSSEAMEERNKNIALESVEGINQHDAARALKDVAADAIDYGDGSNPPVRSKDSVVSMVNNWMKAFPDVKGENLKAVSDGEWVVVWGDWSGTWKGGFMGQQPTGKSYKIKDADIFRFNSEGKITEHHSLPTWYAMAAQVGMKVK